MAASETCSACGDEVRWGVRDGVLAYHHRGPVDHVVKFGRLFTEADRLAAEAALDEVRYTEDGTPYTTREWERKKMSKKAREAAQDADDDFVAEPLPEPEVTSTPIDIGDPRLPGGAKSVLKKARAAGWTAWVTYAKGPRVHGTTGALLEMSDNVLLRARLDGTDQAAVASWVTKNGKPGFEFAYLVTLDHETRKLLTTPANSDQLKKWLDPPEEPTLLDSPYEQETT